MKTFFKKLEYHFLVESSKIENTIFLYETALSEANVKTNRMEITKLNYHKFLVLLTELKAMQGRMQLFKEVSQKF